MVGAHVGDVGAQVPAGERDGNQRDGSGLAPDFESGGHSVYVGIESNGQRQVPWLGLAEWEGEDRRQREGELISHACRCVKLWVRVIVSDK